MERSKEEWLKPIDELLGHPGHTLHLTAHRDGVTDDGRGYWTNEYLCLDCQVREELSSIPVERNCPCYDLPACPGELDPDLSYEELNAKYGFGGCGFEGS